MCAAIFVFELYVNKLFSALRFSMQDQGIQHNYVCLLLTKLTQQVAGFTINKDAFPFETPGKFCDTSKIRNGPKILRGLAT